MNAHWRIVPHDPAGIDRLSRGANISPLVAQLLLNRGINDPARARAFLDARLGDLFDPERLPGAVEAAERIVRAIRDDSKIIIYGDYDVDGVCGTSILWECLRLAGAVQVEYYIPHRVEEGYGLNAEALRKLAVDRKADLIVTVDCGISAVAEAELARELGVELIITDHHTIGFALPRAAGIVHPRLPGGHEAGVDLCGAAVAFKLAWQVCKSFGDGKRASPQLREFLKRSIGLVALATIADMVPLSDENRVMVRHGLSGIAAGTSAGLKALMEVSGSKDKKRLTTGMVGFGLAPRINAAGRLEQAMMAVEMLTTDDPTRAREIALLLDCYNKRRQEVERQIFDEAQEMIKSDGGLGERRAIVLGRPNWHAGVIGIVAGRLAEAFHRPTVIIAVGEEIAQGSARSIPGFDLYEALKDCSDGLIAYGGHAAAAGLKLAPEKLPEFARRFEERCRTALSIEQLERALTIDAEIPLGVLSLAVVAELEKLEPHGISNPRPLLLANSVEVVGEPRPVGEKKNHLQIRLRQGDHIVKAIAWNLAEKGRDITAGSRLSAVFTPSINEWNNRREVQLEIKDFVVEEQEPGASADGM
jgi:single-stranded-DNA-specific exonuclease